MQKSAIEWCDMTFNPITGCMHECDYCYARGTARRFGGFEPRCGGEVIPNGEGTCPGSIHNSTHGEPLHIFDRQPMRQLQARGYPNGKFVKTSYPYNFEPTFHRYCLDEPQKIKKPQTVFVGSMADMFGDWVPDEWINEVFETCKTAPWHRYLFLTKNPKRLVKLGNSGLLPRSRNYWFGASVDAQKNIRNFESFLNNAFLSIEPLLANPTGFQIPNSPVNVKWVIVGAETGNRKNKITPKREWIENIVDTCREAKIPVFLKNNLVDAEVWGKDELIQEYPWEVTN